MVAITVILAAVIAAFVFGLAGSTQTTRTVGTQLSLDPTSTTNFTLQFTGGSDLPSLAGFKVSRDGAPQTSITISSPGYSNTTQSGGYITPGANNKFQVGQIITINLGSGNTVSGHKITILGTFTDGGSQILWDRTL